MDTQIDRLTSHWRTLMQALGVTANHAAERDHLIELWSAPERRYHGPGHLEWLLDEIDRQAALFSEPERIRLAAWYHDAVYDTHRNDNEAISADLARESLTHLDLDSALVDRVCDLIVATASHRAGGRDRDDNLFLDIDCAILGAEAATYDAYADAIRQEYGWAPGLLYSQGRGRFLEEMTQSDRVFLTDEYEARLGDRARENMRRELNALKAAI